MCRHWRTCALLLELKNDAVVMSSVEVPPENTTRIPESGILPLGIDVREWEAGSQRGGSTLFTRVQDGKQLRWPRAEGVNETCVSW